MYSFQPACKIHDESYYEEEKGPSDSKGHQFMDMIHYFSREPLKLLKTSEDVLVPPEDQIFDNLIERVVVNEENQVGDMRVKWGRH